MCASRAVSKKFLNFCTLIWRNGAWGNGCALENISGKQSRTELLDLLNSHEPYYDDMPEISDLLFGEKELEEQSTAQLRRTWTQVKKRVHLPVSKLSKTDVLNYLYTTADFLD